jgi:hypothetical protein
MNQTYRMNSNIIAIFTNLCKAQISNSLDNYYDLKQNDDNILLRGVTIFLKYKIDQSIPFRMLKNVLTDDEYRVDYHPNVKILIATFLYM